MKWNEFAKRVSQMAPIDKRKSQTAEYALQKAGLRATEWAIEDEKICIDEARETMLRLFTAIALAMECNDYNITDEQFELEYYRTQTYLYEQKKNARKLVLNEISSIFGYMSDETFSEIFFEMPDIPDDTYSVKLDGRYKCGRTLERILGYVCADYTKMYRDERRPCRLTSYDDDRIAPNSIESIFDKINDYIDVFDALEI